MNDDWLWNREGTPDPEVEALERALRPLRYDRPPPVVRRPRWPWVALALAAAALFLASRPQGWAYEVLEGAPCRDCALAVGEWLETDDETRIRLDIADIGTLEVSPGTRLRLDATGEQHRIALAEGRIEAFVVAPPRMFVVDTPSAAAVDLGCAYVLEVAPDGTGRLHVTAGMVALEAPGRRSVVIHDAVAETRSGHGPGMPVFEDAPEELIAAARALDFEGGGAAELGALLGAARAVDTLTLWHALQRVPVADRARVFDRIAALVPGVLPTDRDAVLALDPGAIEVLWRDLAGTWGAGVIR